MSLNAKWNKSSPLKVQGYRKLENTKHLVKAKLDLKRISSCLGSFMCCSILPASPVLPQPATPWLETGECFREF